MTFSKIPVLISTSIQGFSMSDKFIWQILFQKEKCPFLNGHFACLSILECDVFCLFEDTEISEFRQQNSYLFHRFIQYFLFCVCISACTVLV